MALSNLLVYDGALKCGSDSVAEGQIDVDVGQNEDQWLQQVFRKDPYSAAVFINTSQVMLLVH